MVLDGLTMVRLLTEFSCTIAMPIVVVRQRKAWRRRDGVWLYFEVSISPHFRDLLYLLTHFIRTTLALLSTPRVR